MTKNKSRVYTDQLTAIGDEISMLMVALNIDIDTPNLADRVLNNDDTVCGYKNTKTFEKLRHHLLALYPLEERSIERIGAEETKEILDAISQHLRDLRNNGKSVE